MYDDTDVQQFGNRDRDEILLPQKKLLWNRRRDTLRLFDHAHDGTMNRQRDQWPAFCHPDDTGRDGCIAGLMKYPSITRGLAK
jgi:hypothetical protein